MQGDRDVIAALNGVLTTELSSINQYFLHARMFKNWGIEGLNSHAYNKSIKDMKQADKLIERIFFLDGLPNLQHLERLRIGENTAEIFECDMALELDQLQQLRDAIALCESKADYVSRDLLTDILNDEENHVDWLETQQSLIENTGIENYIQSQL